MGCFSHLLHSQSTLVNSNKCLHTADKVVVVHAMTHRDYGSCSEESCIASVLVELPHGSGCN